MDNLGNWLAEQLITEQQIKTVLVVYPGRFQPMGQHHAEVYKKLASKFGKSNTFVVTSDKVSLPKSPLNFKEKQMVMKKHGITNVVQVKNPYQAQELTKNYDPETTAMLFAVGKKDMQEDPRFRVGLKKNGEPSYFQHYDKNQNNLQPFSKHGYLVVAPHVSLNVPGFGEMSGTTLRQALATADAQTFKDIMGFYDPKIYNMLQTKFMSLRNEDIENFLVKFNIISLLKESSSNTTNSNTDVDDGPRYFYGSQKAYEIDSKRMAESLGFSVLNYIMDGGMSEMNNTTFPDGPPMGVSYFPVGAAGATMSGTDYTGNIKGKPAYKKWSDYISNVATQVGYKFLNFLGAEDSIASTKDANISKPESLVQEQIQNKEWWSSLMEDITIPINIGDTVLMGKFKNKKVVVKSITKNEKGDYLINGRPAMKFRLIPQVEETIKKVDGKYVVYPKKGGKRLGTHASRTKAEKQLRAIHANENIIKEAKANTHLTHLEELILTQGQDGYKQARDVLIELIKNLKGNSNAKVNTTVKWDGAPALFAGINPENGKFFVGTKSVFNKVPLINYTDEDIDRNHGGAPGLAVKLKKALKVLPSLGIRNILQGDFMFDDSTLKLKTIDGIKHYVFKPNAITYAVEVDSDLGRQLEKAELGIVFHTGYKSLDSGAEFGANVSGLNRPPAVWFDDAFFKDTTGTVLLTNDEAKQVAGLIKKADSIKVDYDKLPSALLNIYINKEIRSNEFLNNPKQSYDKFITWVQSRIDTKVDKLKSERGKQKAIIVGQEQMAKINDAEKDILNVFNLSKLLAEAKLVFVRKYNNAVYNTKHFKDDGKGGLAVTAPEGYVAIDRFGNGVKLVDRLEFSRANFAMDKGFTK